MLEAVALGLVAGLAAGMLGIGGGALIVPGLVVFLGLGQVEAEATSLLAIVPTALVGAWRQRRYGNLRLRDGLRLGVLAVAGAIAGAVLANVLPVRALELAFAALLVVVAVRLARTALRGEAEGDAD
ncbi:MAG TPA: sulfite exporter TauE/SafE family protein [Solirubrobacteraceae bacterium]|nr:sulfite exporter TauE/SafE family protein [Solirubrobacteraceae bacterium]